MPFLPKITHSCSFLEVNTKTDISKVFLFRFLKHECNYCFDKYLEFYILIIMVMCSANLYFISYYSFQYFQLLNLVKAGFKINPFYRIF